MGVRPDFFLAFASGHAAVLGFQWLCADISVAWFSVFAALWTATMAVAFLGAWLRADAKPQALAAVAVLSVLTSQLGVAERVAELVVRVEVLHFRAVPRVAAPSAPEQTAAAIDGMLADLNGGQPQTRSDACTRLELVCVQGEDARCEGYLDRCRVVEANPFRNPKFGPQVVGSR